ncbi:MAG: sialidase family protein, partial [Bryobacteraceae bacterium]
MRLASILFSVVALAATPPTQIDFEGRISIISALPDGTLISLYTEGRPIPQAGEDGPEQHTYLRTSADSGRTWSRPQRAFSYPAGKGSLVHPVYSMVDRKGWI